MSEKGLDSTLDIRVIDGYYLRYRVKDYLNYLFNDLERCLKDLKCKPVYDCSLAVDISFKIRNLRNVLALLRNFGLIRITKYEALIVLLASYNDEIVLIRKEREV